MKIEKVNSEGKNISYVRFTFRSERDDTLGILNFRAKRIKEFRALETDRKLSYISLTIG